MKRLFLLVSLLSLPAWGGIEDNSFLLEEAFNQKKEEYQFIQKYYTSTSGYVEYLLEIEAPLSDDETHQISLDISRIRPEEIPASSFSDLNLNYRYQALNRNGMILTEKIGLVLATGKVENETSNGAMGAQLMQVATFKFSERFMNHWNLGTTIFPEAETAAGEKTILEFTGGTSLINNYSDNLNFLLEAVLQTFESYDEDKNVNNELRFYLNPGLRFALDFDFKRTQVVPGVSFPVQYSDGEVRPGVFLYLSVESTLY